MADTAAVMAELDLVLSSCTAPAHLAGALGRPTWIMLPAASDWRWLLGRDDSPWYPTARLFRQATPGDWSSVVERLDAALTASVDRKRAGRPIEDSRDDPKAI
jgi:ADP-heptose:LPS heptosyltransferase